MMFANRDENVRVRVDTPTMAVPASNAFHITITAEANALDLPVAIVLDLQEAMDMLEQLSKGFGLSVESGRR